MRYFGLLLIFLCTCGKNNILRDEIHVHDLAIQQHTFSKEGADLDPEISADGKYLYFSSNSLSENYEIYRKQIDGATLRLILRDPPGRGPSNKRFPKISRRNPSKIAFSSDIDGKWGIYYVENFDKDPQGWIKISQDGIDSIHPSWSEDDSKIVYCAFVKGRWVLRVYDFPTKSTYTLPVEGLLPEWAPRGNEIIFQRMRKRGRFFSTICVVEFKDARTSPPKIIVESSEWAAINPSWSADGEWIAFATVAKSQKRKEILWEGDDIWVVRRDGTMLRQITFAEEADWLPCWSSKGRIFFTSKRKGAQNIWSLQPALFIPGQ
jgi:Tol biopolymer transport system component